MNQTRIYLPLSVAGLRTLAGTGVAAPARSAAHAVTADLVRTLGEADQDEREYAALCDAIEAAGRLRAAPGERRVVAAADVPGDWLGEADGSPSSVVLAQDVPRRLVVSLHVDEAGAADDDELLWYDITEVEALLAEL